jgi:hypothetical protein
MWFQIPILILVFLSHLTSSGCNFLIISETSTNQWQMSPSPSPTSLPHCLEILPNSNKPLEAQGPSFMGGGMTSVSRRFSYETLTLYPHSIYIPMLLEELFKINLCGVVAFTLDVSVKYFSTRYNWKQKNLNILPW